MDDGSTLDTRRPWSGNPRLGPPALTFTVLFHPDPARIGETAVVPWDGDPIELSRVTPGFSADGRLPRGLEVRGVSRAPLQFDPIERGAWRVHPSRASLTYTVDGGRGVQVLTPDQIATGAVVSLGGWVLLFVRGGSHPVSRRERFGMVGASPGLETVRDEIARLAPADLPVLVRAETGCGKELVARALHEQSNRASRPYQVFNIAAVQGSAAVSQLFGHVRGAFTGAAGTHDGYFAQAHTGTLFIDEIGEAEDSLQPLLLRALDQREIQPLGGKTRQVDVRLVFATDANLETQVAAGTLRKALFHRLDQVTLTIPPLRDRPEDIALQAVHFLRDTLGADHPKLQPDAGWLSPEFITDLVHHRWPGNTRELLSRMQEVALRYGDEPRAEWPRQLPDAADLGFSARNAVPDPGATAPPAAAGVPAAPKPEINATSVREALLAEAYKIGPAAKRLGLAKNTLYARMAEYGIPRPRDLDAPTIEAALSASDRNIAAAAQALQVSSRGLQLRMKELDLE